MAKFTDRKGQEWTVELHLPLLDDIKEKHGADLLDLEQDPLAKLRNDPMTLVAVTYLICEEQIQERGIDPRQFGRSMPTPPDPMLNAIREAIVDCFATSRAAHVRESLAKWDELSARTDALAIEQMQRVLDDPKTAARLQGKADSDRQRLMDEWFPLTGATPAAPAAPAAGAKTRKTRKTPKRKAGNGSAK